MTQQKTGPSVPIRLIAVAALTLAAAGCGVGGGDSEPLSADELEQLLPTDSDLGSSWREVDPDDDEDEGSDDEFDAALRKSCPQVAALDDEENESEDSDDAEAEASFADDADASVDVSLSSPAEAADEDELTDLVEAFDDCDEVQISDEGVDGTLELSANLDDTYGDQGLRFTYEATIEVPQAGVPPINFEAVGLFFREGSVGVEVTATGTFDPDTLEEIPADEDLLDEVASGLESAAADAQG